MEPSVKETNGEDAEKGGSENSKDLDFPLKKTLDADDPMLGFLTLLAKVERPACANCESKDVSPMFYCNTCGQAICSICKHNTHSAKMFSRHDISSVSPYTREPQRKCPVHHELCIMFSPANESLLCINCFRDLPPDIRAQCLDLDTAYSQKCERLQKGLKAVGKLEVTIQNEASTYCGLLKELHINAMREESTIHVFGKILHGVIIETEERLIEAVKRELQSKEVIFEEKLSTLESLQSNVQAYLTLSTAFINSASKYELLKLANGLVERLSDIGAVVQPSKISPESSCIGSNFKSEFSQSLKEMFRQEIWMQNLIDTTAPAVILDQGKAKNGQLVSAVTVEKENIPHRRIALPFLGRSQSLLNIPINLDANDNSCNNAVGSDVCKSPVATCPLPQRRVAKRKEVAPKFQSLPKESKKYSNRSKSVDASQLKSPHYDVSQVELFATIQSRKAVNRGDKKVLVTSLVGVRKSDRIDDKKKDGEKHATPPVLKNQSGNLCVVQAMVHQDGNTKSPTSSTSNQIVAEARKQRRPDAHHRPSHWEPLNESLTMLRKQERNQLESESIELTADQVRELIKAISAAQNPVPVRDDNRDHSNWVPAVSKETSEKKDHRSTLHRNDSFEGHEQAVRMLVDAVREIQQIYTTKGNCEHG